MLLALRYSRGASTPYNSRPVLPMVCVQEIKESLGVHRSIASRVLSALATFGGA